MRIHLNSRLCRLRSAHLRILTVALLAATALPIPAREAEAQWFAFGRAQRGYDRCVSLYDAKRFDETRTCIRGFMSNYPNSRWIEHLLFLEAKLETDVYEAQVKMHGFVQEFPEGPYSAEANYSLAQLSELEGDYAAAQRFYLKVYDYFPASELRNDSVLKAAKCMVLSGDAEAARLRLEAYLAGRPEQPFRARAKELYADALFESGEFRRAQQEYKEIISQTISPQDAPPEYYIKIAGIYEAVGNDKAALLSYRRFLEIFPDATQRQAVERKMAELASHLRVNLSVNGRPHVIEAGLFESKQEAMRLVARLKRLGYQAYLVTRSMDRSVLISVRLGPYGSRDSALAAAERLNDEAGLDVTLLPQGRPF